MTLSDLVTEVEYGDVLEGIKDLLKETYSLSDNEVNTVMGNTLEKADRFLDDYMPYLHHLKAIQCDLRDTFDVHFEQAVNHENKLQIKMSNDAAIWLTFECIRRYCKKSF